MAKKKAPKKQAQYVVVRSYGAGAFAGELVKSQRQNGVRAVVLNGARRLWKWAGAATLSEVATSGVGRPAECKFGVPVNGHEIENVIEVIPMTEAARISVMGVAEWRP